jgi:hypothetical protein
VTKKNKLIGLSVAVIAMATTPLALASNFACPKPAEIQSTDFTAPTIWIGPPMAHSAPNAVGVGLGGKQVKEFVGAQAAQIKHKKGWVCVYKSAGGLSVHEYQAKIRHLAESNPYLKKYLARVNEEFANAEPYLKNYPQDEPLGFVGYQIKEDSN